MLEIRNVTKIYRSKSGNEVKALDDVSVTFPETGMVFILGKSGSGKSTLLNVVGGLDGCDDGEFIIKGKSSKDFAGSDFDAYRNTFIGFIFQEYNILDDFTVGANIGLALELQGKKATNEKITEILQQVELTEYAKRKPNELSGGQKQRIAIARALVKDPEIIMADEPTGALDSNTGKQIFDTLKELSKNKLVIIVSHDRDFAERYADRIIEMKDGKIATDITKHEVDSKPLSTGILQMNDNLLKIEKGYQLTAEDVKLINKYLASRDSDIILSGDKRLNDNVRSVAGISEDNKSSAFYDTVPEKDVKVKSYDGKETKFIRSSLPMKNALKMGTSSLGHKKVRLVFTIFLSLIAFALFGFADTLGAYDKHTAATESIIDTNIKNASFTLGIKYWNYYEGELTYEGYQSGMFNGDDISALNKKLGINFTPVFNGSENVDNVIQLTSHMKNTADISSSSAYQGGLYGFATLNAEQLQALGYSVVGNLPSSTGEIAISKFIYEQFNHTGFQNNIENPKEDVEKGALTMNTDGSENSIIGKHLELRVGGTTRTFKITAVIDTQFEYQRYEKYIPKADDTSGNMPEADSSNEEELIDMLMQQEMANTLHYGFHCIGYVISDDITDMSNYMEKWGMSSGIGTQVNNMSLYLNNDKLTTPDGFKNNTSVSYLGKSEDITKLGSVVWVDGNARTKLGENEMLVDMSYFETLINSESVDILQKVNSEIEQLIGQPLEERTAWDAFREYCNNNSLSIGAQFKPLMLTLFKINADDYSPNIPDSVYEIIAQNYISEQTNPDTDEKFIPLSMSSIKDIYHKLYAANAIYATGSTVYKDDEFIYTVITNCAGMSAENYLDTAKTDEWRKQTAYDAYLTYLTWGKTDFSYGTVDGYYFTVPALEKFLDLASKSYADILDGTYLSTITYDEGVDRETAYKSYKVVGIFTYPSNNTNGTLIINDTFFEVYDEYRAANWYQESASHENGIYAFVIAPMPTDPALIRKMVDLSYADTDIIFELQNQVMYTLSSFNSFIEIGASVFIYVGLGFALFAALMMMNFISTSISYKRREIGILRAVGARSSDVFKIFFSEALIIALINYILSLIATIVSVTVLNTMVRNEGINVTLLNFGIRQVALMLGISVLVALIASFLPVWRIARRKPVDAIKNT